MKKYFLIMLIICVSTLVWAQQNMEDVIYLNNGGIIRGVILENKINEYIKIETVGRNVFVFQYSEIEKTSREVIPASNTATLQPPVYLRQAPKPPPVLRQKGYYNVTEIGFLPGSNGNTGLSAHTINGYKFNPHFSVGGSFGVDAYWDVSMFPIAVDVRGQFFKRPVTPFYYAQAGYSIPSNTQWLTYTGGFMSQFGAGMQFTLSDNVALLFSLGLKQQKSHRSGSGWGWGQVIDEKVTLRRTAIKIGLLF